MTLTASVALAACGGEPVEPSAAGEMHWDAETAPAEPAPVRAVTQVAPRRLEPPAPIRFQPAYHLALRSSVPVSQLTTFRLRVPLLRGGSRVRVAFRAGDGALTLPRAFVATQGHPTPLPLRFGDAPALHLQAWQRQVSEPVELEVQAGEDLVVTFEAQGALAASAIEHLPGGEQRAGGVADRAGALGGTPWKRAVGVMTVDTEGPPTRALVAIGDSITEAYTSGMDDDVRRGWPNVASLKLGLPIVNAGVSGQGVLDGLAHLDQEVTVLEGITDCIVFLGTNDLHGMTAGVLSGHLTTMYGRLRPFCHVWGATLLPKERSSNGPLEVQLENRRGLNAWMRMSPPVEGVLDFDAVLRNPAAPDDFIPGTDEDGIHPNAEGYRRLGEEAARFLQGKGLTSAP